MNRDNKRGVIKMKVEELFNQLNGLGREELVKEGREAYALFKRL